jgi:glycosyltransferase involved in cell wall biosynthesis
MKIAIIAPSHIPALRANTIQVMKMAQAIASSGHQVCVVSPENEITDRHTWNDLARHYGLQQEFQVVWLLTDPRMRRYDFSWRAVQWVRSWGANLLYTRLPQAAAIASNLGFPTIYEIHDLPQGTLGPWLFRLFLKGKGARRLVVITQALNQDLSKRFNFPESHPFTVVTPDGVDMRRYSNLPSAPEARSQLNMRLHKSEESPPIPSLKPNQFTAGYTGHLYAGRGIEMLLSMAAQLPEIAFLIVGGEPQEVTRLRVEIKTRNLENVMITGFIPNSDLPYYQACCDVLLMPYQQRVSASSGGDISRYLSPMKLFEYMACGRAILSSDLPVLREMLNNRNAILIPPQDVNAWIKEIELMRLDPSRLDNLGSQALKDVKQYTWQARSDRILDGLETGTENTAI